MAISKVWLDESSDSCIACGACESVCPDVFAVEDKMTVKEADFNAFEAEIADAASSCPAGVIKFE